MDLDGTERKQLGDRNPICATDGAKGGNLSGEINIFQMMMVVVVFGYSGGG